MFDAQLFILAIQYVLCMKFKQINKQPTLLPNSTPRLPWHGQLMQELQGFRFSRSKCDKLWWEWRKIVGNIYNSIFLTFIDTMQLVTIYTLTWIKLWAFTWDLKFDIYPGHSFNLCQRCWGCDFDPVINIYRRQSTLSNKFRDSHI